MSLAVLVSSQVTREEARAAIDEQFGGDNTTGPTPGFNSMLGPRLSKLSSAYMLLVRIASAQHLLACSTTLVHCEASAHGVNASSTLCIG